MRLRVGRGPSPRYCGICGAKISDTRPDGCVNDTPHIPETEMELPPMQPKRRFKILARVTMRGRGKAVRYDIDD